MSINVVRRKSWFALWVPFIRRISLDGNLWIRGKTEHADFSSQFGSHPRAAGRKSMDRLFNRIHSRRSDRIYCCLQRKKKKEGSEMCLVQTLKGQICHVYSPSGWGACPGLSSCLSLSDTSDNSKHSRWDWGQQQFGLQGRLIRSGTGTTVKSRFRLVALTWDVNRFSS